MQSGVKRIVGWISVICVVMPLLACDFIGNTMFKEWRFQRLQAGSATETEVVNIMGDPDRVWQNADGSHTLSYPLGPQGIHTWMVTANQSGLVTAIDQVLTDAQFAKVVPGLDKEAVLRLIGRPRRIQPFDMSKEEVWDWRYQHYNEQRFFNVHFNMETGVVVRTSFSEIMKNN